MGYFFKLLQEWPAYYWSVVATVIVSVTLHELGHVFAAIRQGDDTPRLLGHVTLNPVVHMGWTSLLFTFFLGIGWGQTPVQPLNFRTRHGNAIVSWSGPAVNLVLAAIGLLLAGLAVRARAPGGVQLFLLVFGQWNIVLFLFNMIPIPPLDGSQVVADASPRYAQWIRDPAAQPVFMIAMAVLFLFAGSYLFEFASIVAHAVVGAIAG